MTDLETKKEIKDLRREIRELRKDLSLHGKSVMKDALTEEQAISESGFTKSELEYQRRVNPQIIILVGDTGTDTKGRSIRRNIRYSRTELEKLFKKPI